MLAPKPDYESALAERLKQAERDLAEAREAAHVLEAREERLRQSLDAAHVGTWEWNIPAGVVRWSENLERIHGQAAGSFQGTFDAFRNSVCQEDRERVLQAIRQATTDGKDYEIEYRSRRDDNTLIWLEARGRVTFDEAGSPVWMLGTCMDITGQKEVQQQLRQTQKMESLGLLAGGIAHDFNNLLTGILGNATMAFDWLPAEDPARPLLQDVVLASRRAADLTRQLLAYAGRSRLAIEDIELSSLVKELVVLVGKSIPDGVELQLQLAPMCIKADAIQIQQLMMNLVINAAESIGEGKTGTVTIATRLQEFDKPAGKELPPGRYVCLEVRDDGCGMEGDTVARIFDPFFSTKFAGRGLGLAAALGIVRGHQGTITVQSSPGCGSTFTVLFPASDVQTLPSQTTTDIRLLSGSGTILVVDDEDLVLRVAATSLAAFGYVPLLAADGRSALEIVDKSGDGIHAVVLDLIMPGVTGEETLQQLRAIRPDVPVIIASGCGEVEYRKRFADQGISGFLPKPYTGVELARAVRAAVAG